MNVIWNSTWSNIEYHNVAPSDLVAPIGQTRVNSMITSDGQLLKDTGAMDVANAQPSGNDAIWASCAVSWRGGPPSILTAYGA